MSTLLSSTNFGYAAAAAAAAALCGRLEAARLLRVFFVPSKLGDEFDANLGVSTAVGRRCWIG